MSSRDRLVASEELGSPVSSGPDCAVYRTRANGAHLAFGNTLFKSGFQLSIPNTCGYGEEYYTWRFAHKHSLLAESLVLDDSNAARGPNLRFTDSSATPIPFRYRGKLIFNLRLQKNKIYRIAFDLTGEKGFTMWLTGISAPNASHPTSAVDVISDRIS